LANLGFQTGKRTALASPNTLEIDYFIQPFEVVEAVLAHNEDQADGRGEKPDWLD